MGWISGSPERYETLNEVYDEWDQLLDHEIPYGLHSCNSLQKLPTIYSSEEEAIEAIEKADVTGMVYAEVRQNKETAKLKDARALLAKEQNKLLQFLVDSSIYNAKSGKTVGCTKCDSSFPRDYFLMNKRRTLVTLVMS